MSHLLMNPWRLIGIQMHFAWRQSSQVIINISITNTFWQCAALFAVDIDFFLLPSLIWNSENPALNELLLCSNTEQLKYKKFLLSKCFF